MTFVRRFWVLPLYCYYKNDEETLVEICIGNIVPDYRVYLDNVGISQFSRLLEVVRKTSMLVKLAIQRSWRNEKKEAYQALVVEDRSNYNPWKRKERDGDKKTYLLLACNDEEFHAIFGTMFADAVIKPPRPCRTSFYRLSNFEKDSPCKDSRRNARTTIQEVSYWYWLST